MLANKHDLITFESAYTKSKTKEVDFSRRWDRLCDVYLPFSDNQTFWRYSRTNKPEDPKQGWKIHVSAIVLQACDLFEKVAPLLVSQNVRFKAPRSLQELMKINSGLDYGYWQVGKFLTIYPSTETEAIYLAHKIHEQTSEFFSIAVPFDQQYLPNSSVFYRYGAFEQIETKTEDGLTLPAVQNLSGELVYDDRLKAVPDWLVDPFQVSSKINDNGSWEIETPLWTTYKVFRAITQRGKGGTYQALDLNTNPPKFCIVKEGRRFGEVFWNGQDGYELIKNEKNVLEALGKAYKGVPKYLTSFKASGNFYLVMEYIEGKSLRDLMKFRKRRFSIKQVLTYSLEIVKIIEEIHIAGWIWGDCKPANLIVMQNKSFRPIDFEGAHRMGHSPSLDWKTRGFSKPKEILSATETDDLYALGAVIYFLLTGIHYNSGAPVVIEKLRRGVPYQLKEIISNLLTGNISGKKWATEIRQKFNELLNSKHSL